MADGIEVGAAAPELELVGSDGTTRRLTDFSQPVVLYMMRAYNGRQCRGHVRQLADRREEIERLGAEIVVTVPEDPEKAARVASQLETPFPIWATESDSPHQVYGLDRAWLGMVQRSGTVVIAGGTVRYVHVATNPDKSIDLDEVIDNLKRITGGIGARTRNSV